MNNVTLVGRLIKNPEIIVDEEGNEKTILTLAVSREYHNSNGTYDNDFIRCVMWDRVANSIREYCQKGDIVGIKGKLRTNNINADNNENYIMEVFADKITFLSSNKNIEKIKKEDSIEMN